MLPLAFALFFGLFCIRKGRRVQGRGMELPPTTPVGVYAHICPTLFANTHTHTCTETHTESPATVEKFVHNFARRKYALGLE